VVGKGKWQDTRNLAPASKTPTKGKTAHTPPPATAENTAAAAVAAEAAAAVAAVAAAAAEEEKAARKLTAAVREGAKKGAELAGNADMGGHEFVTTQIEKADGDCTLLRLAMEAANKETDTSQEDAKGGSGEVGKMFVSSGMAQVALHCYVPKSKCHKCNATEWMTAVLETCEGQFVQGDEAEAVGVVVGDGKIRFPLKDKDTCQSYSVGWLKNKGLFPQAQEEDDWVPDDDCGIEW